MKRIMLVVVLALGTLVATAMPSKEELAKAQSIVNELMKDHIAANKKGKESHEAVGDAAMSLAKDAEGEAAKLALFKGAVTYYARGKAYDKAADAIEAIVYEVSDVPPQTLNGIVSKAAANVTEKKSPRLVALKKAIAKRAKAAASLNELEANLKKSPNDTSLKRMHAELVAATGDWKMALDEFATLGGEVGMIARDEANGNAATAADFWWDYVPAATEAKDAIKEHASTLYRKALDLGELEGLKRNLAEKRIAEFTPVLAMQKNGESQKVLRALKSLGAKKVEYLESTGAQCIILPINVYTNSTVIFDGYISNHNKELYSVASQKCNQFNYETSQGFYRWFSTDRISPPGSEFGKRHLYVCSKDLYIDGKLFGTVQINQPDLPTSPVAIFAGTHGFASGRCWRFAVVNGNGATVLDLQPVRIGNDGAMFDRVSGLLFRRSGKGSFIVGPDL